MNLFNFIPSKNSEISFTLFHESNPLLKDKYKTKRTHRTKREHFRPYLLRSVFHLGSI